MSENTGLLPDNRQRSVPPILYALVSNALQIYGVLSLGWHFFPILYLWWWEELIISTFGVLKLRRLRPFLTKLQSEDEIREGERAARSRFFLLFVYFVFVVIMGGFVFAPKGSYIENVITLIFRNQVFNFNLLLFVGMQAWMYWRDFYQEPDYANMDVKALQTTLDLRSAVIHVGLLAGAFLSFLLAKYQFQGAEHAFMFGFMAIKTGIECWSALRRK